MILPCFWWHRVSIKDSQFIFKKIPFPARLFLKNKNRHLAGGDILQKNAITPNQFTAPRPIGPPFHHERVWCFSIIMMDSCQHERSTAGAMVTTSVNTNSPKLWDESNKVSDYVWPSLRYVRRWIYWISDCMWFSRIMTLIYQSWRLASNVGGGSGWVSLFFFCSRVSTRLCEIELLMLLRLLIHALLHKLLIQFI